MDFRQRAHTALERDEPGRALMILVNGLRRAPERDDAVDFFLFIYIHHIKRPGMETELLRGLEFHGERAALLGVAMEELHLLDKPDMARALEDTAEERGVAIAAPEPVAPEPEVSREPDASDSDVDESLESQQEEPSTLLNVEVAAASESDEADEGSSSVEIDDFTEISGQADEAESRIRRADARANAADGTESESPGDHKIRRAARPKKRRIFAIAVGVSLAAIALCVAIVGWKHARDVQLMWAADEAISTLDPLRPRETLEILDESTGPGRSAEIADRRRFVLALMLLESGDGDPLSWSNGGDGAWALGAAALEAATEGDWEEAMRHVHHLEHSHGDSLPSQFAGARICEARRQWECASSKYERVQEEFDQFVAGYTGAMRVAAHRVDADEWERQRSRLIEVRPEHGYVQLPWVDPFALDAESREGEISATEEIAESRDQFLELWTGLAQIIDSQRAGDFTAALEYCNLEKYSEIGRLAVFEVACAQAAAVARDVEQTRRNLDRAVQDSTLEQSFYRQVQILGPRLLTDLGRADWALAFTVPADEQLSDEAVGEDVAQWESRRPAHFRPSGAEGDPWEDEAVLVRSRTLVALGATEEARQTLSPLLSNETMADRARFEVVWSHLVEGNRRNARRALNQLGDDRLQEGARAYEAYLEGRHADAHRFRWAEGDDPRLLRVQALAFMADGRGRDAMAVLDGVEGELEMLSLLPTQMRVLARAGEQSAAEGIGEQTSAAGDGTSLDYLIDHAGAAFWQRDLKKSEARLEKVLKVAPEHAEANWKMGLVRRVEDDDRAARRHFQRAWRGDEDSTELLVELGRVHLEYGRQARAREVFLRAVLRDRNNVAAVEGLGRAYDEGDRKRGRRDLAQLLENYSGRAGEGPARSEMLRWLAILHGSRQGDEGARVFLERAREAGGDRTTLLIESGRLYAAQGRWQEAREEYGRALRMDPTLPEVHLRLAEVAKAQDDGATAREHLDRLWRLMPVGEMRRAAEEFLSELDAEEM